MISHGSAPFLECSSRGDNRFSAFYALVDARSIEDRYQAYKVFDNGETGLSWRQAKGKQPINAAACAMYYSILWDEYIRCNPHLLPIIQSATGLSDMFGQPGHCCQATELWRIRNQSLSIERPVA